MKYFFRCLIKPLDEDDDGDEIPETPYSSGDSNASDVQASDEERLPYKILDKAGKIDRQKYLWQKAIAKIRGAVLVLMRFGDLEKRINLFGTSIKFEFDLQIEQKPAWYIIMPESEFRIIWNIIMVFCLVYTATLVPFRTAFVDEVSNSYTIIETLIDVFFIVDVLFNFMSAYVDQDRKMEIRVKTIAANYIRTWFFPDFFACIPF